MLSQFIYYSDYSRPKQHDIHGVAYVSGACKKRHNGLVVSVKDLSSPHIASVMAHELGHTLGLKHNDGNSTSNFLLDFQFCSI